MKFNSYKYEWLQLVRKNVKAIKAREKFQMCSLFHKGQAEIGSLGFTIGGTELKTKEVTMNLYKTMVCSQVEYRVQF